MDSRYARVLPANSSSSISATYQTASIEEITHKKRPAVIAACDSCRHKKIRCDGKRPECASCLRHGIGCNYATGKGESRSAAMKRKYNLYEQENVQMKQILEAMRTKPHKEALAILSLLRSASHLMEAFDHAALRDLTSFEQTDSPLNTGHAADPERTTQELHSRSTTRPWELAP